MRWDDVYVSSSAVVLGIREPVADAVAAGRYDQAISKAHGYASISVANGRDAVDMAADAARAAITRSGVDPADIGVFIHAAVDPQGIDEPASYIQGKVTKGRARALGMQQGCNGAIAALEIGCMYLAAVPGRRAVLTSADKYAGVKDRYSDDEGCVSADGATAMVLSREDGVVAVLSTEIVGDGRFSGLVPLDPARFEDRKDYRAAQRKRVVSMVRAMSNAKRDCVAAALADAGIGAADVSHWLMPYSGRFTLDVEFYAEFGIDDTRTTWDLGRTVGHTTGGDQVIGLTHLLETGAVAPGDRVVMLGDSAGFSFGCAVLEVARLPQWQADD